MDFRSNGTRRSQAVWVSVRVSGWPQHPECRQDDADCRTDTDFAFDRQLAAVQFDEVLADGQAEAGALYSRLKLPLA